MNKFLDSFKNFFGFSDKETPTSGAAVPIDQLEKKQAEIRNTERLQAEREYSRKHPEVIKKEINEATEYKIKRLKNRLNIAIITVIGLLVLVVLILFYI
ncbi:hypothetical protein [Lactobacillus terrae]|uniref:hypothetical protein n=1 Tax=Lactobacillus terrae TaxID=2269374 RepID=UPI000C1B6246|nr:hypothetical protein [Lactobacillus terrae]